jgi:hypothetical protein
MTEVSSGSLESCSWQRSLNRSKTGRRGGCYPKQTDPLKYAQWGAMILSPIQFSGSVRKKFLDPEVIPKLQNIWPQGKWNDYWSFSLEWWIRRKDNSFSLELQRRMVSGISFEPPLWQNQRKWAQPIKELDSKVEFPLKGFACCLFKITFWTSVSVNSGFNIKML